MTSKSKDVNKLQFNGSFGAIYSKEKTQFTVFSTAKESPKLAIYDEYRDVHRREYEMQYLGDGIYYTEVERDLDGKFYTYLLGDKEVTDPYSYSSSINSQKSAIIDLEKTNPKGFLGHEIPVNDWKEAILYETHVADFTIDESSGVKERGKFLGMAQADTSFLNAKTGLDHLEELGITYVHLLPVYDFISVDEKKNLVDYPDNYNWGYDPELYNTLEGSYSTDPYDPKKRIYEFKYLVQKLHERGISVVLDVVYNHTFKTLDSNFNTLAPGYYYRNNDGIFSNASGCGNEFASDKKYGRKFIIDSLKYWVEEFKVDGFRFDLMAILDIDTILEAIEELRKINPNIIIYGEPWMALDSLLAYDKQITIGKQKGHDFSIFNPFYRDALKGDNDGSSWGYIQGNYSLKGQVQEGIAGSIAFHGGYSNFSSPLESINYFNAHDNLIFQDKLVKSGIERNRWEKMTIMVFSILMMSQGLPFFHAGNEFLRDKKLDDNSYNSSAEVNGIDWSLKKEHEKTFKLIKDLIKFRKDIGIFNLRTRDEVMDSMEFIDVKEDYLIAYTIKRGNKKYIIVHNSSGKKVEDLFRLKGARMIWSNGFKDDIVDKLDIEGFTSNVYEIGGKNEL